MTVKTWFTADTHFGHTNILKYCNRPWPTIDAMEADIIDNINSLVAPLDRDWETSLNCHYFLVSNTFITIQSGQKIPVITP